MVHSSIGPRFGFASSLAVFATTLALLLGGAPAAHAGTYYPQTTKCSNSVLLGTTVSCSYTERCATNVSHCLYVVQGHSSATAAPKGITGTVTFSRRSDGWQEPPESCSTSAYLFPRCDVLGPLLPGGTNGIVLLPFPPGASMTVTCTTTSAGMQLGRVSCSSDAYII